MSRRLCYWVGMDWLSGASRWTEWVARGSLLVTAAALAATSCDSSSGNGTPDRFANVDWYCFSDGASCECFGRGPDNDGPVGSVMPAVVECGDPLPCCLLTQNQYGYECRCENLADCPTEAASRQDTEVAPSCPPVPRTTNCAKAAENCRAAYLTQMGYPGCCSGLTCVTGSDGVPTCQ
jgi:hypothetical protein